MVRFGVMVARTAQDAFEKFQFQYGAIWRAGRDLHFKINVVSIPVWCDLEYLIPVWCDLECTLPL